MPEDLQLEYKDGWKPFGVYELGEFYYRHTLRILHEDCGYTCGVCSGSGEGMADGSDCTNCKGKGWIKANGDGVYRFEVSWTEDNLSDLNLEEAWFERSQDHLGSDVCEYCGHDFVEEIKEELRWLRKRGNNSSKKKTLT
jgi:hypothetical protein